MLLSTAQAAGAAKWAEGGLPFRPIPVRYGPGRALTAQAGFPMRQVHSTAANLPSTIGDTSP